MTPTSMEIQIPIMPTTGIKRRENAWATTNDGDEDQNDGRYDEDNNRKDEDEGGYNAADKSKDDGGGKAAA